MKYIKFVRSLGKNDIKNQNTIDNIHWENNKSDLQLARKNLSMKLSECLPNVLHAETIEKKAINLLNHPTTLVLLPTTQVTAEKEISYLAAGTSTQETYKKIISAKSLVKCSCKGFRYSSICSHSTAGSEKERISNSHISKFKSCRSQASITYPIKSGGEDRKGRQKRRQRLYEEKNSCTQENLQPFTEVWHKNEPLILTQVKDVPIIKMSKRISLGSVGNCNL